MRSIGLILATASGLLLSSCWVLPPQPAKLSSVGDGDLTDQGWRSYYPRYTIRMPPLPVYDGIRREYALRDVPMAEYLVFLEPRVDGQDVPFGPIHEWVKGWPRAWQPLRDAGTVATVRVVQASALRDVTQSSPLTGEEWSLGTWGGSHLRARTLGAISLRGDVQVHLEILLPDGAGVSVTIPDNLTLQPVLRGGGKKK